MTNDKNIIAVIGIVALIILAIQLSPKSTLPNEFNLPTQDLLLARKDPLPIYAAYDPKRLIDDESPMVKLLELTPNPTFSVVQPNNLFTIFEPSVDGYCCESNDLKCTQNGCSGFCDFQCSGSFAYCDSYCNPPDSKTCPEGYVLVNSDQNCCPSSLPYYKDGYCFPNPVIDYPTASGCPNSICDLVTYPTIGTGSVLYHPVGFDPTLNCQNKFGNSPTGIWFVDSSSACCFAERTNGEYGASGNGVPSFANTLGILCSDRDYGIPACSKGGCCNTGCTGILPCSQSGATATCHIKSECSSSFSLYCEQDYGVLYKTCTLSSSIVASGVQLTSYYKYSPLQNCGAGKLCLNNQCVGDSDSDGVPDSSDLCLNTIIGLKVDLNGCPFICKENEVKLVDGTCKAVIQTCIDNNLNNICDLDDPIVWMDPATNTPICADRNADRICDGVESLFCKDSNNNKLCDSDEVKWLATYCLDENSNGVCDGIESGNVLCPTTYTPVCDPLTNITYPNLCFANGFNVQNTINGECMVDPIIIRLDCATGDVPIPSGYICDFETGWLIRRDTVYLNTTIDCRTSSPLQGYTCTQVGVDWVWTKTELVNIDCFSKGCPKSNQLCQGGICIQDAKRCPLEVNCTIYGADSVCDNEIGLCTKIQYLFINTTKIVNQTTIIKSTCADCPSGTTCASLTNGVICTQTTTEPFTLASIPLWVKIGGGILIIFIILRSI